MLDALIAHWPYKLLAVGLAFAIWVAVTGENLRVQDFNVPVDFQIGEDCLLTGDVPTQVLVRLRGPEALMRRVGAMEMRADLSDAPPGERTVKLRAEEVIGVPRGVEVVWIEPDLLTVTLDKKVERRLPVIPSFVGKPPEGHAFYGAQVVPESVTVVGPASQVASLTRLRTDPIRLSNRTEPFRVRVFPVAEARDVKLMESRPVEALVQVDAAPEEIALPPVPVVLAGQVYEAKADPSTVQVTLAGPPALLGSLKPGQVRVVADVSDLEPRKRPYHLPVRVEFVDVPPRDLARISVKSVSRKKVAVTIAKRRIRG